MKKAHVKVHLCVGLERQAERRWPLRSLQAGCFLRPERMLFVYNQCLHPPFLPRWYTDKNSIIIDSSCQNTTGKLSDGGEHAAETDIYGRYWK